MACRGLSYNQRKNLKTKDSSLYDKLCSAARILHVGGRVTVTYVVQYIKHRILQTGDTVAWWGLCHRQGAYWSGIREGEDKPTELSAVSLYL
jgi:hypothetical protein